jgi:hypothetical protein
MKRIFGATVLMGLMTLGATSAEAADRAGPGDDAVHQIVVVNESVTPVRVYVEDGEGRRYELGSLERGQTRMFESPEGVLDQGDFRVRVHPDYYAQHKRDPATITTRTLSVADDETVILWLERELVHSKVEVRAG